MIRWISGPAYPYRRNSLNLFRLVLAALVLFAHSWYLAGRGSGPQLHGENLGGWAVAGFFVISGFLITRSRFRTGAGDYILHRVARIYPAFLVCLVVTAAVFGPLALLLQHGSLAGYATTGPTPLGYVWGNLRLFMVQYSIGDTLATVPYPDAWNGSLWTLFYEFACYIVVWVLAAWSVFRRSAIPAVVLFCVGVVVWANVDIARTLGLDDSFVLFFKLAPFFFGGIVVYYVIDRWGMSPVLGCVSIVIAAMLALFVPGWGGQAAAPFLAYALLFLATIVRQPTWIANNDVSYGFYIYAWPLQQLVALAGGAQWGMVAYITITIVLTAILAVASWYLVERPCMRRVRGRRPERVVPGALTT